MLTTCITVWLTISGLAEEGSPPTPSATVRAVGIGYPPPRMHGAQARLMTRRAAEVVAVRNLAAKLGLGPRARLPAFRYVATKHLANGSVEVTVETTVAVGPGVRPGSRATSGARPRGRVGGCR
ncbi:MAG: hypothetical protein V1790_16935 [Planctomycetota bacterium]